MLSLQGRPSPRLLTWLFCALFLGAFLIDFGESSELVGLLGDALHVPIFAVVSAGLFAVARTKGASREGALLISTLASVGAAIAIEIIQPYFGRSESLVDLENGVVGSLLGAFAAGLWPRRSRSIVFGFALLFGSALVAALVPAWNEWKVVRFQQALLPILGDFESSAERKLWSPINEDFTERLAFSTEEHRHGRASLEVRSVPNHASGVELRLNALDLSGYESFAFSVFNPGTLSDLQLRIDDFEDCTELDSRFNRSFTLAPGWNEIRVPLTEIAATRSGRRLNLSALRRALFFVEKSPEKQRWLLDEIRVEGATH